MKPALNSYTVCIIIRSIRRYGYDAQLFSFECGRRCPTGVGIYAFRCSKAEELFNVLQEAINSTSLQPIPNGTTRRSVDDRITEISMNILATPMDQMDHNVGNSCRETSQDRKFSSSDHQYANINIHNYINSPIYSTSDGDSPRHGNLLLTRSSPISGVIDTNTNYATMSEMAGYLNVDPVTGLNNEQHVSSTPPSSPVSPSYPVTVNYTQLDLNPSCNSHLVVTTAPATPVTKTGKEMSWTPPTTPDTSAPQKYAMIDFEKTEALTSASSQRRNI